MSRDFPKQNIVIINVLLCMLQLMQRLFNVLRLKIVQNTVIH